MTRLPERDLPSAMAGSLRIAFLTPKFHPERGGSETWSFNVLRSLAQLGHRVEAISGFVPNLPRHASIDGVTVYRPGPVRGDGAIGRARWMSGFAPLALAELRMFKPDVVLGHHSGLALATVLARKLRIPSIGVVHDVRGVAESCRRAGIGSGLARVAMLERSLQLIPPDLFIVNSRDTARKVKRIVGTHHPIRVVPIGADHGVMRSDHVEDGASASAKPARIVFVGRLVPEKGPGDLIDAVSTLRERGYEIEATLVGDGPERERLQRRIATRGAPARLLGWISDEDLDAGIRDAQLLVLPSTQEGWGLVLTESAVRGVPYVAYDIPAVREQHALLHGGILVSRSSDALAQGIASLLDDPALRSSLARAGREATKSLRWEASARAVASIVEQMVRAKAA